MKKKLLSALLSVALVATLLVGCGNNGGGTETTAPADDTQTEAPADSSDEAPAEESGSNNRRRRINRRINADQRLTALESGWRKHESTAGSSGL